MKIKSKIRGGLTAIAPGSGTGGGGTTRCG